MHGGFTTCLAMFGSGVPINTTHRSMVRIVCFVAVAGLIPSEVALPQIAAAVIRPLQSMISVSGSLAHAEAVGADPACASGFGAGRSDRPVTCAAAAKLGRYRNGAWFDPDPFASYRYPDPISLPGLFVSTHPTPGRSPYHQAFATSDSRSWVHHIVLRNRQPNHEENPLSSGSRSFERTTSWADASCRLRR